MAATMHRSMISESKSDPTPFELIYEGAKEKNIDKVRAALLIANLNVQQAGYTPVGKLALEDNKEALDFLIAYFPAERPVLSKYIIASYAERGHTKNVAALLVMNPTEHFAMLQYAIIGYARGGHVEEVYKIIRSTTDLHERAILWESLIAGFARSHNKKEVEKAFSAAIKENPTARMNLIVQLASNYARGGHIETAEAVLSQAKNETEHEILLQNIILGSARGGYVDTVNRILKLMPISLKRELYPNLISAYAQSGLVEEVDKLFFNVINSMPGFRLELSSQMIYGFARGGHVAEVNKNLCLPPDHLLSFIKDMQRGYQDGEHITKVESTQSFAELIYEGAKERSISKIETALSFVSLHVNRSSEQSPAIRLALEGNKEALAFLIARYPLEKITLEQDMVYGFVCSDRMKEATDLIKSSLASRDYTTLLIKSMVSGLAEKGKDIAEIKKIIASLTNADPFFSKRLSLMLYEIAYFYGRGGHVDKLEKFARIDADVNEFLSNSSLLTEELLRIRLRGRGAEGCAIMGYEEKVNQLVHALPLDKYHFLSFVVKGYARSGRIKELFALIKLASNLLKLSEDYLLEINLAGIINHAAQSSKITEIHKITEKADKKLLNESLIEGYATGGYIKESHRLFYQMDSTTYTTRQLGSSLLNAGHIIETINLCNLFVRMNIDVSETEIKLYQDYFLSLPNLLVYLLPFLQPRSAILQPEPKLMASPFTLLYQGAKEKNLTQIKLALHSVALLATKGKETIISLLVSDQNEKALDFLIKHFPEDRLGILKIMAQTYAKAGKMTEVDKIIHLAMTPVERHTLLHASTQGYAEGEWTKKIEEILANTENPLQRKALIQSSMQGYAACGNEKEATRLFSLAIKEYPEDLSHFFKILIFYFAYGEMETQTLRNLAVVKEHLGPLGFPLSQYLPLVHYNRTDRLEEMFALLADEGQPLNDISKKIMILGGQFHFSLLNDDLETSNLIFHRKMEVLTQLRNLEMQEEVILNSASEFAAYGQIKGVEKLIEYIQQHSVDIPHEIYIIVLENISNGYILADCNTEANKILNCNIADPTLRLRLLTVAINAYCKNRNIIEANKILSLATPTEYVSLIKSIAETIMNFSKSLFINKEEFLFFLATFNIEHQKPLADALIEESKKINWDSLLKNSVSSEQKAVKDSKSLKRKVPIDIPPLLPRAAILHRLINKDIPFIHQYDIARNWPQLQEWLILTGRDLNKKEKKLALPQSIILKIAGFIAGVSFADAAELQPCLQRKYRPTLWTDKSITTRPPLEESKLLRLS